MKLCLPSVLRDDATGAALAESLVESGSVAGGVGAAVR
jgi:hypothetical protein